MPLCGWWVMYGLAHTSWWANALVDRYYFIFNGHMCCNPNIGFMIKCEVQGPMRSKMCLGVKHTFTNGGERKGWSPMTPNCTPTLGVAFVRVLWMFIALVGKENKHQITIKNVLRHRCFRCPCLVHLDLICMNYDQKKGRESNSRFENWIGNLIPDHKSLERKGQMKSDWGLLYTVENIFMRTIRCCPCIVKIKIKIEKYMGIQSFGTTKVPIMGLLKSLGACRHASWWWMGSVWIGTYPLVGQQVFMPLNGLSLKF
jgi:hypothetical protein